MPNGLCLSPDGRTLYVDDTSRGEVKAFTVADDGSLRDGRLFASEVGPHPTGSPDGMKCDERGDVWVTGPGGVWIFDVAGRHLGTLGVPEKVANLNWAVPTGGAVPHRSDVPVSSRHQGLRRPGKLHAAPLIAMRRTSQRRRFELRPAVLGASRTGNVARLAAL